MKPLSKYSIKEICYSKFKIADNMYKAELVVDVGSLVVSNNWKIIIPIPHINGNSSCLPLVRAVYVK